MASSNESIIKNLVKMKYKPSETVSAQNRESEQMAGALWVMALLVKMIMMIMVMIMMIMVMMIIEMAMTRIFNVNEFYHSSRFGEAVKHRSGEQSGEEISTGFGRPEIVIIVR